LLLRRFLIFEQAMVVVVVVVRMAVVCMAEEHPMVLPILLRIIIPCQRSCYLSIRLLANVLILPCTMRWTIPTTVSIFKSDAGANVIIVRVIFISW